MSPRRIQMPMSSGDRKHYARELAKARSALVDLERQTKTAYRKAYRLECEAWNARQFVGGAADPSPTIGAALEAGFPLLEVLCRTCRMSRQVALAKLGWPSAWQVHRLEKALFCHPCWKSGGGKRRPDLIGLIDPTPPGSMPADMEVR